MAMLSNVISLEDYEMETNFSGFEECCSFHLLIKSFKCILTFSVRKEPRLSPEVSVRNGTKSKTAKNYMTK